MKIFKAVIMTAVLISLTVLLYLKQGYKLRLNNSVSSLIELDRKIERKIRIPSLYIKSTLRGSDTLSKTIRILNSEPPMYEISKIIYDQLAEDDFSVSIKEDEDKITIEASNSEKYYSAILNKYSHSRKRKFRRSIRVLIKDVQENDFKVLEKYPDLEFNILVNPYEENSSYLIDIISEKKYNTVLFIPFTSKTEKAAEKLLVSLPDSQIVKDLLKIKNRVPNLKEVCIDEEKAFSKKKEQERLLKILKELDLGLIYAGKYSLAEFDSVNTEYSIPYERVSLYFEYKDNYQYITKYLNLRLDHWNLFYERNLLIYTEVNEDLFKALVHQRENREDLKFK